MAPPRKTTTGFERLSWQQYRIIILTYDGLGDREIAKCLGLALKTVQNHFMAAFEVMGVSSRTELALAVWKETEGKAWQTNS